MKHNTLFLCILSFFVLNYFSSCTSKQVEDCIDYHNFDSTVKPVDNFFQFVNGNWIKNNPIPPSDASWNNFTIIRDQNLVNLKQLLEKNADQKVGVFYNLAMDSNKLNKDGYQPIADEVASIEKMKDIKDVAPVVAHLHVIGVHTLFDFSVGSDPKASTANITTLNQGGIGLPDMDYYINQDPSMEAIRAAYRKHINTMFQLMGEKVEQDGEIANGIFDFEKNLANSSMTRVQLRDIEAQYNKKTLSEFTTTYKNFDWSAYFAGIQVTGKIDKLIVGHPQFFKAIDDNMAHYNLDTWKNYLKWCLYCSAAGKLSDPLVEENFHFYGTVLNGAKTLKPRWKRAITQTDASLGDLLGQLFVKQYFSEEAKQKVNQMVDNLLAAYKVRLESRDWMGASTKKQALEKLNTIVRKLGFPDKWKDCSTLVVERDAYVKNYFRANSFEFALMCNKLGKPVDKTEWEMSPPTVNAYYNPSYNEIVFPAGIMQPPFFNANADDAVNYGAMGAVIGHELTHGFDDQGCQYDAKGNLKNWWTPTDSINFKQKTNKVIDQFNQFSVLDSLHINGELTIGENIADLGGLTIAYYAYEKSLEGKPKPEKISGFTGEQRFFISWAQGWRGNMRPEYLKQLIKTNPHAPNIARVICPLSNMKEFYAAFGVKEGDKMFRSDAARAEIW